MGILASEEACASLLEKLIDCSADNLEDHYSMGNMIGEGRFSKVYAGVRARARGGGGAQPRARSADARASPQPAASRRARPLCSRRPILTVRPHGRRGGALLWWRR